MNYPLVSVIVTAWLAVTSFTWAGDSEGMPRQILDASQKPFVEFVQRTIAVQLPPLPSPSQAEANRQLYEVSLLLWKRLLAVDLYITVERRAEQIEMIKAMCSLHKWLVDREGYTNLVLASYIQEVVPKALLSALAGGRATLDDMGLIGTLLEQSRSGETVVSVVERMAPRSQVLRDYRAAMLIEPSGKVSIFGRGELLMSELKESPTLDPEKLLTMDHPASFLVYAGEISIGQLFCSQLLVDYAKRGGNLKLKREDLAKDILMRAPELFGKTIPFVEVKVSAETLAIVMERAVRWNTKR